MDDLRYVLPQGHEKQDADIFCYTRFICAPGSAVTARLSNKYDEFLRWPILSGGICTTRLAGLCMAYGLCVRG